MISFLFYFGYEKFVILLCDKCVNDLRQVCGFSPGTPVPSTNKTDFHDITEILLKVALNTINQTNHFIYFYYDLDLCHLNLEISRLPDVCTKCGPSLVKTE
jgi:hypothetical protein